MSKPRPGTKEAVRLWEAGKKSSAHLWEAALAKMPEAIEAKAAALSGKTPQAAASKRKQLREDDEWLRSTFRKEVLAGEDPHMSKDQLIRVMRWKLARGKFRPLMGRVKENSGVSVQASSRKAIAVMQESGESGVKSAAEHLCALRGIGPATASAVLSFLFPDHVAFMADEPLEVCLGKRDYSMRAFLRFQEAIREMAETVDLSVADVSSALWATGMIGFGAVSEAASPTKKNVGAKRKR